MVTRMEYIGIARKCGFHKMDSLIESCDGYPIGEIIQSLHKVGHCRLILRG